MKIKIQIISIVASFLLAFGAMFSSNGYLVGFPAYLFSLLPSDGQLAAFFILWLYMYVFVLLLTLSTEFKSKYIWWILTIAVYFVLNFIAINFLPLTLPKII